MSSNIRSYAGRTFGLNLNDLIQAPGQSFADNCENIQLRSDNGIEKRVGIRSKIKDKGGYGLVEYTYINSNNTSTKELLLIDDSLYRVKEGTLNITYSGAQTHATAKVVVTSGDMKLQLIENDSTVLDRSLGQGYDETSTETLADTDSAIDAISGFSATVTGDSTHPSAFLDLTPELTIDTGTTGTIGYIYVEEVNNMKSNPIDNISSIKNTVNLKNAKAVNHNNLLVLTDGGKPKVYDGQSVYLAGLPKPSAFSYSKAAGDLADTHNYYLTYDFIDARGKRTESALSDAIEITTSSEKIQLNVPTIQNGSGYNTNCSVITGNQTAAPSSGLVTLNVLSHQHSLVAGDTALVFNRHTSINDLKTYTVSSVTTSTLVLTSDDTIQVNDLDPISNNLAINIYRTDGSASIKSLVKTLVNNSWAGSITHTDNDSDLSDNATFTEFTKTQAPPPDADFCLSYKNNLILGKGQSIYYSDEINNGFTTSSLSFPATNFILFKDVITGLAVSGDTLVVFSDHSTHGVVSSTLDFDILNKFLISDHIGCRSHDSISSIGDMTIFLDNSGVYGMANGVLLTDDASIPRPLSRAITPFFEDIVTNNIEDLRLDLAVGVNHPKQQKYFLFIPSTLTDNRDYSTNNSKTLVFDYNKKRWFFWSNMHMDGGAVIYDNTLYWSERTVAGSLRTNLFKFAETRTADDYWDDVTAITAFYELKWDVLDNQTLGGFKKPLNLKIYSRPRKSSDYLYTPTLTVDVYKDYLDELLHSGLSYTFGNVGAKWGFRWGDKPYGDWQEVYIKKHLKSELFESLKVKLTNNEGGVNINISALELEWQNPYLNNIKT